MSKDEAIQVIVRALPYPQHISDWDTTNEDAIRFTWRDDRFRFQLTYLSVEHVLGQFLHGDNLAILVERLIQVEWMNGNIEKIRKESEQPVWGYGGSLPPITR